jgi:glycosyltransferase involved in cell wall biosynthesis
MPEVTVIIPAFNAGRTITAALQSVFAQTYRKYEVIVVDDGSTDDTLARLAPYGDRIAILRTANQGCAAARNVGMAAARGDYIAWLDSDDEYWPFKLDLQARVLDLRPEVGFVYSELSGFDDAGFYDEWHLRAYHESAYRGLPFTDLFSEQTLLSATPLGPVLAEAGHRDWLGHSLYVGDIFDHYLLRTVVFTNSILFRRELWSSVGPQARRFGLFHDLEFVLRLARLSRAAFLDVPTYKLRYHPGQISTSAIAAGKLVTIRKQRDLLRVLKSWLRDHPEYYDAHRAVLDRQLARLHRAIAVPMLAWEPRSAHEQRVYPRRARRHLAKAAALGHPDRVAWATSYVPRAMQRAALAAVRALRRAGRGSSPSTGAGAA